ncbi:hypothetical protein K491DRAFT_675311 [Lophiostoma macrostomum CBS 122681]|uniref:Uncharacterized protein n=1 Tax=Lophiostoma macrostomum CBS 122681 TaxID=1314788 RepID=A0A6A6TK45_9PLEO|nr:hypothetical protein K491DRAFT_675311 [Lophiostoma macrostomum CBS 122681]
MALDQINFVVVVASYFHFEKSMGASSGVPVMDPAAIIDIHRKRTLQTGARRVGEMSKSTDWLKRSFGRSSSQKQRKLQKTAQASQQPPLDQANQPAEDDEALLQRAEQELLRGRYRQRQPEVEEQIRNCPNTDNYSKPKRYDLEVRPVIECWRAGHFLWCYRHEAHCKLYNWTCENPDPDEPNRRCELIMVPQRLADDLAPYYAKIKLLDKKKERIQNRAAAMVQEIDQIMENIKAKQGTSEVAAAIHQPAMESLDTGGQTATSPRDLYY